MTREAPATTRRLAAACLTLVCQALAAAGLVALFLLAALSGLAGHWSRTLWLDRHPALAEGVIFCFGAFVFVAAPLLSVRSLGSVWPAAKGLSALGASVGGALGILPAAAAAAAVDGVVRASINGELLELSDRLLPHLSALHSGIFLFALLGAACGSFAGSGIGRDTRLTADLLVVAALALATGAIAPPVRAALIALSRPRLGVESPLASPPQPVWTFEPGPLAGLSAPALSEDGVLYVGAGDSLVALDASGHRRWAVRDGWGEDPRVGRARLTAGGLVVVGARAQVAAFDRDGRAAWRLLASDRDELAEVVAVSRSTVYVRFGTPVHRLSALDVRSGRELWSRSAAARAPVSVALGDDGRVYLAAERLEAYDDAHRLLWTRPESGLVSVGADRSIYVSGTGLSALTPEGRLLWHTQGRGPFEPVCADSGIAFGRDGTLYFGCQRHVFAYRPDGSELWRRVVEGRLPGPPLVGADGTIYVSSGSIWAFRPSGEVRWRVRTALRFRGADLPAQPLAASTPPVAVAGDTILVGCAQNRIHAVTTAGQLRWIYAVGSDDSTVTPTTGILPLGDLVIVSTDRSLIAFPSRAAAADRNELEPPSSNRGGA